MFQSARNAVASLDEQNGTAITEDGYQDLCVAHIDQKFLSFELNFQKSSFSRISSCDYPVIRVPTGFSRVIQYEGFKNRDEQYGAQPRIMVNYLFHNEFITQVATNTHSASGISIHVLY